MRKLVILLLIFPTITFAQKEATYWYFGGYAGMIVNSGIPGTLLNSAMTQDEGSAVASDEETGRLLFYTNGVNVWNANHIIMPNGTGLRGSESSTQSVLILPKPGSKGIYYIFTTDAVLGSDKGAYYSIVDMSKEDGKGDITTKNVFLARPVTEKLTAIPQCDGKSYWVLLHERETNKYLAYLFNAGGVALAPVISSVGINHTSAVGYLKAAPSRGKVVSAHNADGVVELLDFESATGMLSNAIDISTNVRRHPYGVSFSPDNTKLYVTNDQGSILLEQYDMSAGSAAAIRNSRTTVYTTTQPDFFGHGALQLAPNGKIYLARFQDTWLGVINTPNSLSCNYVHNGVSLADRASFFGLPNFVDGYLGQNDCPPIAAFTSDTIICEAACIPFTDYSRNYPTVWEWNFPGGIPATSTEQNPSSVCFNTPGAYTIRLIASKITSTKAKVSDTTYRKITVTPGPMVDAGKDTSLCLGSSIQLQATADKGSYVWQPHEALSDTTILNPKATPLKTTTYYLTVISEGKCSKTDSVTVTVREIKVKMEFGTTICPGDSIQINPLITGVGVNPTYRWHPGKGLSDSTILRPVAKPDETTTYTLICIDQTGCRGEASMTITIENTLAAKVGNDTAICSGGSVQLHASGGTAYEWTPKEGLDNPKSADPIASPLTTTTYSITVSRGSCSGTTSLTVTVHSAPLADAGNNQTICLGDSTQLSASGGVSYLWSPATGLSDIHSQQPKASPSVKTVYTVIVTDQYGCINSDSMTLDIVSKVSAEAGEDTTVCAGGSVQLHGSGGSGFWQPKDDLNDASLNNPIASPKESRIYYFTVSTASCGTATDSVRVTVLPAVSADAGEEQFMCPGDSVILHASGKGRYVWSPANGLSCTECAGPTAKPGATQMYYLTVSNSAGCSAKDSVRVVVYPLAVADAGSDGTMCRGGVPVQLKASGGVQYSWNPAKGLNNPNIADPMASPNETTLYTVTVTTANGCTATDEVTITVYKQPVLKTGPDIIICNGRQASLSADGADSYEWTPSGGLDNAFIANPRATPLTTTVYTVHGTTKDGCKDSAKITVYVTPALTVDVALQIPQNKQLPGNVFPVDLHIRTNDAENAGITYFNITLHYDPQALEYQKGSISMMQGFGSDWNITPPTEETVTKELHIEAKGTSHLQSEAVVHLMMKVYLSGLDLERLVQVRIDSINVPKECLTATVESDTVYLAEFCSYEGRSVRLREGYYLKQNAPNPVSTETEIEYSIGMRGQTRLVVYNALGEEEKILENGIIDTGEHRVRIGGGELSVGIHYYRLTSGSYTEIRKLIVAK